MKKILKVLGIILMIAVLGIIGVLIYVKKALPKVAAAPDITVELTPERIKRGEYLANHVTLCVDCHSSRDFSVWSGPLIPGKLGQGGERFDQSMNFPGEFYARNITSTHLSSWTDGEIYRAITTGVTKSNGVIFPVMPWQNYGKMDPEDIKDIIAYIRSLPPQPNDPPPSKADFPMNFIMNTMPHDVAPGKRPDKSDLLAYGGYLTNAAGCDGCHTKQEKGKFTGEFYAGGFEFLFPDGSILTSPNITPDAETGIGQWTEAMFVSRFKQYTDSGYTHKPLRPGQMQTVMPWIMYAGMDSTDLKAIYAYLKTVKPVKNMVTRWKPATK